MYLRHIPLSYSIIIIIIIVTRVLQ